MSDGEATRSDESLTVCVVAPETDANNVVEAVTDAGGIADTGSVSTAADSDVVVAVGDTALSDLAAEGVSTPILPVETRLASPETVRPAIERVLAGSYEIQERPLVRVETTETTGHAVFDIALSTAEPARISEFAVDTFERTEDDSVTTGETPVARFRADGVVVATPAGSRGYARAAGGPVVVPGSDAAAVVPISPFATDPDHWVVPLSGVSLTVERDEADVEVRIDGRLLSTVEPGATVRLVRNGALRIAVASDGETDDQ